MADMMRAAQGPGSREAASRFPYEPHLRNFTMKKWIKYGLLTFLVLALLGGVTLVLCLDAIIKTSTEKGVSFATKTQTTLEKADLSLLSGHLKLKNFDLKNPEGFEAGSSFVKFAVSEVQVSPASLASDRIEVGTVNLDGLELSYVKPAEGKANYEVILDNVNRLLPQGGDGTTPKEEPKEKAPPAKPIHVGVIKFTNAKIHANVAVLGQPVKLDVPLPNFEMKDVTVKGGMPELTAEVTKKLIAQLVEQIPEIAKAAVESAKNNIKGIDAKGATDAVKGIGSGIGDLFKRK